MKRQKEGVALAKRLAGHEEEGFAQHGKGSLASLEADRQ